jgi:hypothetical protein
MKRNLHTTVAAELLFGATPVAALSLVDGLNEMEDRAKTERLGQLISDLIDLDRMAKQPEYLDEKGRLLGSKPRALWEKLISQLGHVAWTPCLFPPTDRRGLSYLWAPQASTDVDTSQYTGMIFNLAAQGLLAKVRRCRHCKKWLLASRGIHRFCSVNCRVAYYRQTTTGRTRNREYMRRYRAGLKRRDRENLKVSKTRS